MSDTTLAASNSWHYTRPLAIALGLDSYNKVTLDRGEGYVRRSLCCRSTPCISSLCLSLHTQHARQEERCYAEVQERQRRAYKGKEPSSMQCTLEFGIYCRGLWA